MSSPSSIGELGAQVRLDDPAYYLGNPWPVYARLRQEAPVFWYEPRRCWVVTKHADVRQVTTKPHIFSSAHGTLLHNLNPDGTYRSSDQHFGEVAERIAHVDPPRHRELRRVMAPGFTPVAVDRLTVEVEDHCDRLLDQIVPGEPIEFVESIGAVLPMLTVCDMLGIPNAEHAKIRFWSDQLERLFTVEMSDDERATTVQNFSGMNPLLQEVFDDKRVNPGDDLISSLLAAELDNDRLSAANVLMMTQTLIGAGNDTTRALLSGLVLAMAEHPDQYDLLRNDPDLTPNAVEEALRWVTPARGFIRTAVEDTEIRGQQISAGQRVYIAYDSANRDEEVFPHPEIFDVTRPKSSVQVGFGFGTHVCIGASLVRMEARVFLKNMIQRFQRIELAGQPKRVELTIRNSWTQLPVVFHPA
jgi:cytochrome P450